MSRLLFTPVLGIFRHHLWLLGQVAVSEAGIAYTFVPVIIENNHMKTTPLYLLFWVLMLLSLPACEKYDTQPQNPEELRNQFEGMVQTRTKHIAYQPAIAAAILHNGQTLMEYTHGQEKPFSEAQVTSQTLFPLASATKIITSVAVGMALQEGRVDLNQPVIQYVENLPDSWKAITLRHLLTHTDGLQDGFTNPAMGNLPPQEHEWMSRQQYVDFAAAFPLNFAPGKSARYGQTGFVLLSMVLEKVYGKKYEDLVKEKIFIPLGMQNTYFTTTSFRLGNFIPQIYEPTGDSFKAVQLTYPYPDYATAAVSSTLQDMIIFMNALQQNRLLSATTLRQLVTPTGLTKKYALGLTYQIIGGRAVTGHSGGWSVVLAYVPDKNLSTIFLSNTSDASMLKLGYQLVEKAIQYTK
jgi:CubicO group peptidase (beta-lactamase class C family)